MKVTIALRVYCQSGDNSSPVADDVTTARMMAPQEHSQDRPKSAGDADASQKGNDQRIEFIAHCPAGNTGLVLGRHAGSR